MQKPEPLLQVVCYDADELGDDVGICAGFERGEWREKALVEHVMEWLPEFALPYSELQSIGHHNAVRMIRRAANTVYQTDKYGNRGEFGEILLHIALRQVFNTIPAVSKIYYKNSVNKTVEGFDAVHVVSIDDELELWIGETKFYSSLSRAIKDVCEEIVDHLQTDYLKNEFLLIRNKIDPDWPHAEKLAALLNENTSLDDIFVRAAIPVLLTYDSNAVGSYQKNYNEYKEKVQKEFNKGFSDLRKRLAGHYSEHFDEELNIIVHVILLPLKSKKALQTALHNRMKEMQS